MGIITGTTMGIMGISIGIIVGITMCIMGNTIIIIMGITKDIMGTSHLCSPHINLHCALHLQFLIPAAPSQIHITSSHTIRAKGCLGSDFRHADSTATPMLAPCCCATNCMVSPHSAHPTRAESLISCVVAQTGLLACCGVAHNNTHQSRGSQNTVSRALTVWARGAEGCHRTALLGRATSFGAPTAQVASCLHRTNTIPSSIGRITSTSWSSRIR